MKCKQSTVMANMQKLSTCSVRKLAWLRFAVPGCWLLAGCCCCCCCSFLSTVVILLGSPYNLPSSLNALTPIRMLKPLESVLLFLFLRGSWLLLFDLGALL